MSIQAWTLTPTMTIYYSLTFNKPEKLLYNLGKELVEMVLNKFD